MKMDEIATSVAKSAFGLSMGALWQHMSMEVTQESQQDRSSLFFEILENLMSRGIMKLARDGEFLSGDIIEQLNVIRLVWPENPKEDDLDGFGMWFLTDAPAGIVWITSDGNEVWT